MGMDISGINPKTTGTEPVFPSNWDELSEKAQSFYWELKSDYERDNPVFKEAVKLTLTPLLTSLTILNYVDIDTEQEMLGYGIGVILLNIGMYFVAPAIVIVSLKKRFKF